jgi:ABC-type lipoprotein release transport system permease subunit
MHKFLEIAQTGLTAVLLHPLRSVVTTTSLVVILLPYTVALAISQGLERQAEDSIRFGADLYVAGSQFGRDVPVPLVAAAEIEAIDGVTRVVPRITGNITLGKDREPVILLGLPLESLPPSTTCVEGRLFRATSTNELVVGTELARRLRLTVGSLIPPFYRNERGERVSEVVGIFRSDVSLWQSRLVFTSVDAAAAMFDQQGQATHLLVYCRPGYEAAVRTEIIRLNLAGSDAATVLRLRVTSPEDLRSLLSTGLLHRGGIFNLHFLLVFVVGILVVLVTSGLGLAERRREIGILKATGWQTDEILLRSLVESFQLSAVGASVAVVLAFVWLRGFNGFWIAGIFLAGVDVAPSFSVPCSLTAIPVLVCFLISLMIVLSGTLSSAWRAATVSPAEAMR